MLAFASGLSILSVLQAYLPNADIVKLIAAALAFISGIVTVISQTYFDDKEILRMFEGAAEFHAIRERLQEVLSAAKDASGESLQRTVSDIRKAYIELSKKYDDIVPESGGSSVRGRKAVLPSNNGNTDDTPSRRPSAG